MLSAGCGGKLSARETEARIRADFPDAYRVVCLPAKTEWDYDCRFTRRRHGAQTVIDLSVSVDDHDIVDRSAP
jgi:hypothetical protein